MEFTEMCDPKGCLQPVSQQHPGPLVLSSTSPCVLWAVWLEERGDLAVPGLLLSVKISCTVSLSSCVTSREVLRLDLESDGKSKYYMF